MIGLIITLSLLVTTASSIKHHPIYWNTTNSIFRIDKNDNIIDINQGNSPWEYDQVNIICPSNSQEKHVIYSVSKEEFDSCRLFNPRPKIVAKCDKPQSDKYVTITFRPFSPVPGGLEFKPGEDYYFISTSNIKDINNKIGGYCYNKNMKTIFKVADNSKYLPESPLLQHIRVPGQNYHHVFGYPQTVKNHQVASYQRYNHNQSPFSLASFRQRRISKKWKPRI